MLPLTFFILVIGATAVFSGKERESQAVKKFPIIRFHFQDPHERVAGGKDAARGQFPYQVSLRKSQNEHLCGGSILNKRWILSAAHCLCPVDLKLKPKDVNVATGTVLISGGNIYPVEKIILHEKYHVPDNDIALLKTSKDIQFDEFTQPISLPISSQQIYSRGVASGWGLTSEDSGLSRNLQYLEVDVLSNEDCTQNMNGVGWPIDRTNICTASPKGQGLCSADSGGPLVSDNQLIGVLSWGPPCGSGGPDVFARVAEYKDWINEKMAQF